MLSLLYTCFVFLKSILKLFKPNTYFDIQSELFDPKLFYIASLLLFWVQICFLMGVMSVFHVRPFSMFVIFSACKCV